MPEVVLRAGIDPDEPDEVLLAVVIDPDGSPGEQAVTELGDLSAVMEDDGVCYVQQTDAWADAHLEDGVLTVDILIYEAILERRGVDVSVFPERSPRDPEAVRVLRVTGTTTHDTMPDVTLVYTSPLDELDDDELPLLLAPPPKPPEATVRAGLDPDNPEAAHVVVIIDPDESSGEWALAEVGENCHTDDDSRVVHVPPTDAWAETRVENGELTVDILITEKRLRKIDGIAITSFEERSPHDPRALRVVRATGTTDHHTLPNDTLVFMTPLDQLDDDKPLLLAPPPTT